MTFLILGRRERGKTTLAYYMARKVRKRVIIDARRLIQRVDVEIVHSPRTLRLALADLAGDETLNEIVYQPDSEDLDAAFEDWTRVVRAFVIAHPDLPLAIMVDEASFYELHKPGFQWLCKCTPRERVHLLITAHRPSDIPTSVRAIADHWCIFATRQEHDLRAIEDRTGSVRVSASITRLRDRDYVHWDDSHGVSRVCDRPADWYTALRSVDRPSPETVRVIEPVEDQDFELEGE
jgi:hypothetical protein